ncbi:T9SS type A sorting domain-containing protein [Cytophagaceae bacterium ABcell3]|nr:T9SS type A sorting domain-containing protein [Cytophagaceae bacterium ABcell3]
MKKIFTTVFISVFSSLVVFGQENSWVRALLKHETAEMLTATLLGDSLVLVSHKDNANTVDFSKLAAYDMDGNHRWTTNFSSAVSVHGDLIYSTGSSIYTCGTACSEHYLELSKLNPAGEVLDKIDVFEDHCDTTLSFKHQTVSPSGQVFLLGDLFMAKVNESFEVDWVKKGLDQVFTSANFIDDDKILFSVQDGLVLMDSSAEHVIRQYDFETSEVLQVELKSDSIYVLTSEGVFLFDTSFNILASYNEPVETFTTSGDYVWFRQKEASEDKFIRLNNDFSSPEVFDNFKVMSDSTSLLASAEQLFMIGNSLNQLFIHAQSIHKDNTLPEFPDIALNNVTLGETRVMSYLPYGEPGRPHRLRSELIIEVENTGSIEVNAFGVMYRVGGMGYGCQRYSGKDFEDISLKPGEVKEFTFSHSYSMSNFSRNMCFTLNLPNKDLFEVNLNDNTLCEHLPLSTLKEETMSIKVYPNPVQDVLTITMLDHIHGLEILSHHGKSVQNIEVEGKEARIDVSHLSAGLYLLKVFSENGMEVRRFTKL